MSASRETILIVVLVSLVTSALAVAGALAIFAPQEGDKSPGGLAALSDTVKGLEQKLKTLEASKVDTAAFDSRLAAVNERMGVHEKSPHGPPAAAEGAPAAAAPPADGTAKDPSPEEAMGKMMAEAMKVQFKRERDRWVNDLMNPSPDVQRRIDRERRGWSETVTRGLELDEREKTAVEQAIAEADQRRRDKLRDVFQSKPLDQISYAKDLKPVVEDSFADEDRLLSQILPPDKAELAKQNADQIRGFMTTMAAAAFPEKK